MCEYCTNNTHRLFPIIETEIDYGVLGKSTMAMAVRYLEDTAFLTLSLDNYGLGGQTVKKIRQIDFCPMCGAAVNNRKEP